MTLSREIYRCRSFLDSQLRDPYEQNPSPRLAVTISRQSYSRSHAIAERLVDHLERLNAPYAGRWALFDQNLVEQVLEDHELPKRLAQFMPENRDDEVRGLINELVGLHPSLYDLFRKTCETIYRLARMGHVILIGRGAHIVCSNLPTVIHLRMVGSFEARLRRLQERENLSERPAMKRLHQEDLAKAAYVRSHFDVEISDPQHYDMVINTDRMADGEAVGVIVALMEERLSRLTVSVPHPVPPSRHQPVRSRQTAVSARG